MIVINVYAEELRVGLFSTRSVFAKTHDVAFNLRYSNTGNKTIHIYKWCLPDNELRDPLFHVTCNNAAINYVGPLIKRRKPTMDDVISIPPGKTIGSLVRISSAYDLNKTCNYSIKYHMSTDRVVFRPARTLKSLLRKSMNDFDSDIESNPIELGIEGRSNIQSEQNKIMSSLVGAATI
ncbi:unnamed protein product, partial [Rotaria sp. Silwood1]